jgi:hypothetical protein
MESGDGSVGEWATKLLSEEVVVKATGITNQNYNKRK